MRTRPGCRLAISIYPSFTYDSSGGGGDAAVSPAGSGSAPALPACVPPPPPGALAVSFDPARLSIPALDWRTTRFLGLPLPPGLEIAITPITLAGWVDRESGRVALAFDASFQFSAFGLCVLIVFLFLFFSSRVLALRTFKITHSPLPASPCPSTTPLRYRPPPIPVETLLSTEAVAGQQLSGAGTRLDAGTGAARLAGVSRVPLNDAFLSWFLRLPADCLAEMQAVFEFGE